MASKLSSLPEATTIETNDLLYLVQSGESKKIQGENAASIAAPAITAHNIDTTSVHGIADTSLLSTSGSVNNLIASHNSLATAHGLTSGISAGLAGAASPGADNVMMTRSAVAPSLGLINVHDYGAVGNGTADDTTAIQAAIAAAIGQSNPDRGGGLIFPPGLYVISDTVTINQCIGLTITGAGRDTILEWNGANDRPMTLISNSQQVMLSDFEIECHSGHVLDCGIQVKRTGAVNYANRKNRFENIFINNATLINDGFVVGGAGAYDANNDFNLFSNCYVTSARYNYKITGTQSFNNIFWNCDSNSGVNGLKVDSGYFDWFGGSASYHSDADFSIASGGYHACRIQSVNCEGSKKFIYWSNFAGAGLTVENCRWSANEIDAGGEFIYIHGNGYARIVNNTFGDSMSISSVDLLINWYSGRDAGNAFYYGSGFEFVGNKIITDIANPPNPFNYDVPTSMRDNLFRNEITVESIAMPCYPATLTDSNATPRIEQSPQNWLEANNNPTSITNFLHGFQGKIITIEFTTSNTTIVSGTPIKLAGGVNFVGSQYDTLTLYHNGTCWIEIGRSVNA
jgi:hypothetical protein